MVEFVSPVEGAPREAGSARERPKGGAVFIQLGGHACRDAAPVRKAARQAADVEDEDVAAGDAHVIQARN